MNVTGAHVTERGKGTALTESSAFKLLEAYLQGTSGTCGWNVPAPKPPTLTLPWNL